MSLDHVDIKLRDLNGEEVAMHAKKLAGVVELDARRQVVADIRHRRVNLLIQRNQAAAAELRMKAEGLRRQVVEIRAAIRPHAEALEKLEGISIDRLPGRRSDDLERQAGQLEREARQVAAALPRATGNVRGDSLDGLIAAVYADPAIIPPRVDAIHEWGVAIELRRFGQPAPHIKRQYHLIWSASEIDETASSVMWQLAVVA